VLPANPPAPTAKCVFKSLTVVMAPVDDHASHDATLEESSGEGLSNSQRLFSERTRVNHRRIGDWLDRPVGIGL
jgi:hypothetical protein